MTFHRRSMGPKFNEGARLLWLALADSGESIRSVESRTTASVGASIRWLYGDVRPMTAARFEIQQIWKVPAEAWDQPPSAPFVPPALRDLADVDQDIPPVVADLLPEAG